MSDSPRPSYGRAAVLGVLIALLLTVSVAVGLFLSHYGRNETLPLLQGNVDPAVAKAVQLTVLLTILLISALLILLFVVGSYLLIRVGRLLAKSTVGGKPTPYVDAWSSYRLTDEQIAAATAEQAPDDHTDNGPPGSNPRPPPDRGPEPPPGKR